MSFETEEEDAKRELREEDAKMLALLGLLRPDMSDFEILLLAIRVGDDREVWRRQVEYTSKHPDPKYPALITCDPLGVVEAMLVTERQALCARLGF